jgi:hypothetical protein
MNFGHQEQREVLRQVIRQGNKNFPRAWEPEEFDAGEHRAILAVMTYLFDMELDIHFSAVFMTAEANYYELCSSYFDNEDFDGGFYRLADELCELDSDTKLSSAQPSDLVVPQTIGDQSNVLTEGEYDDYEGGDNLPEHGGWVPLFRQVLYHGWLRNHPLLAFWLYLLLRASFKEHLYRVPVKRNSATMTVDVILKPGQLVFGRKKAAEETGLSEQNVRTFLKYLKKSKSISVEPTPEFSIVTITNWTYYRNLTKKKPKGNQRSTNN